MTGSRVVQIRCRQCLRSKSTVIPIPLGRCMTTEGRTDECVGVSHERKPRADEGQDCDMAQRKRTISAAPNTRKADDVCT